VARRSSPPAAGIAALEAELARLRDSERMYRFSAQLSARLVWAANSEGRLTFLDYPFVALTGMSQQAGLDSGWYGVVHPDDRESTEALWRHSLSTGETYLADFRVRRADGAWRMTRSRAIAVRGEDGAVRCWYGTTEDVHDQEQAERARRDVETRYRLAVQATDDAVWDYDIIHDSIEWSDNAGAIFGAGGAPGGRTTIAWWEERLHPEDKEAAAGSLGRAIGGSDSRWSASYRFRREDGSYADILDRGFIIRAADGAALRAVGAMSDLTEQHRTESEMRRMQAELIHVSRLSAMGTMASTLAHELNQPLAALSNFISGTRRLAEKPEVPREVLSEALEGAEAAAQRAGEILRRLRTLVSRGTVAMVVDHLPQLIEEACVLAFIDSQALGVRHRLELDRAASWVRADRIQIQQVIINLVRNAVEAMEHCAEREVVISSRASEADMVEISVADTGAGIAEGAMESLFSQFMTTKAGGMGIGLPISRTIVEAHGGKIWAENRDGGGAVFRFTLPRARRRNAKPGL